MLNLPSITALQRRNADLLLVDSGDMHDGNGITDGFPPGDVNGHEVNAHSISGWDATDAPH